MVVFTCGHCGESLQKPKVEKHYTTKCRNKTPNLSCMDCFKDFLGNEYESHIKCITEEQRYAAKGFVAKEKKGEKKQNVWVEMVQSVLDEQKNAPGNVLKIIETISKHNNTPRKKPKFINFVKNVCGSKTNLKDIDQAWDLISKKLTDLSNGNNKKEKDGTNEKGQVDGNINENIESKGEKQNGDVENGDIKQNGHEKNGNLEENGHAENGDTQQNEVVEGKKSRKQRKEEKKRKKYEAELQSVAAPVVEEDEEVQTKKKDKKKKNRTNSTTKTDVESEDLDEKTKNKRKRQDTVNGDVETENIDQENQPVKEKKAQKKKLKLEEQGISLHDQNVAQTEEAVKEKFDWHAVIMSVLQKKDNEVPFKRLQKKVLTEYSEATGREVDDRIADKFIKKLKSAPNVKVDKNRVFLVSE